MDEKKLYLIDANYFCYRAFYALSGLATSFGQPTNAIYGFLVILNKILKEKKPDYAAACFDVSRDTFRQKKFAEYKIQRPPTPDALISQIPFIKQILTAFGIAYFEKAGYEADDIIATIAKRARREGVLTVVVSSDKDILQLVDDATLVFSPYKDKGVTYDRKKVLERFGVGPESVADIMALAGDDVDNIPGIPGIGEKTALELIRSFGSLDNLRNHLDNVKQEKLKNTLKANLERLALNKELVVLNNDVDIDFNLEDLKLRGADAKELFRLFKHLEFKKFLKGLSLDEGVGQELGTDKIKDSQLQAFLGNFDELFLRGDSCDGLIFYANKKFFSLTDFGDNIKMVLRSPNIKKIGHDLKNIKSSMAKDGVILEGLYFDTMLAAYLLNPSKSEYGLCDVAWDYLGACAAKTIDDRKALSLVLELRPKLEKELQDKSLFKLFAELEMPLVEVLSSMELAGIKLDLGVLKDLSASIEKRLIKLVEQIYRLSGVQFNINSPKQLREVLFERLKLPIVKKTKTGPSTDEEVLRKLADQHELPALLLEYRQLTKLKNTYIDVLPELADKQTHRLHTSFNQTGTETGRLSSSNPNLQNIPVKTDIGRSIRRAFISSADKYYLLSCDYSQVELRILAHLSKDKTLIEAFNKGLDIHKATASLICGIDKDNIPDEMRELAKRVNFGIVYGLSPFGLSRDIGVSIEEAQGFIDAYFLRYPKVKEYIQEQILAAQKNGFVTTLLGRKRYIPEINNKNQGIRALAERQAVNTPIQGTASDLIKLAMVEIQGRLKQEGLGAKMVLQIHDELIFDVPEAELETLVKLARQEMENVLKLDVPIKVEIKKGRNWLEMEEVVE